jgi:hypothetical protein
MRKFRTALLSGNRPGVAASVVFPLHWNHGPPWHSTLVRDRNALMRDYDVIFDEGVIAKVRAADPRALFCRNYTNAMLGDGVVWANEWQGQIGVVVVNGSA